MIAALLQARIGSTRLPGKVLKELPEGSGVSMLARIIRRLKKCETLDEIIVVTPDEIIVEIAQKEGVKSSTLKLIERDVLHEFHLPALLFNVDTIVRITGDCPCICPEMIDKIVRIHLENGKDLTCNRNDNLAYCREIDGLDVEVFDFEALEKAYNHAKKPEEREHPTLWMYDNLRTQVVECGWHIENSDEIKLSVDTQEDLDRISKIYEELGSDFTMRQLREYIEKDKKHEMSKMSILG